MCESVVVWRLIIDIYLYLCNPFTQAVRKNYDLTTKRNGEEISSRDPLRAGGLDT